MFGAFVTNPQRIIIDNKNAAATLCAACADPEIKISSFTTEQDQACRNDALEFVTEFDNYFGDRSVTCDVTFN